ncbi:hypothetical protein AUR04nite_00480 [Glutamicibacter uratoxydans]|uniref:Scaffolding protein n=1 Tax=Glutamicibacter uratoxydans TaxID=43667 RepID=A0A4Y4DHK8_GLUUR|nr:hypothetical protein [Glutamicibacter uratoxydans]GED04516.1 hypothetical protein AUR04nite_00480 [Glutamicibacter uratoxydans]
MAEEANKVEGQEPAPTNDPTPTEPEKAKGDDLFEGIPADHPVRKVVSDLRGENASKRQAIHERDASLAEMTSRLEAAKTPEEFNKLVEDHAKAIAEKDLEITRKDVAREFGLPAKVESALSGKDLESLRTEAQEWQELFGKRKPAPLAPSGGRTPAEPVGDAQAMADDIRARRR